MRLLDETTNHTMTEQREGLIWEVRRRKNLVPFRTPSTNPNIHFRQKRYTQDPTFPPSGDRPSEPNALP